MSEVTIKINNRGFGVSCDPGQEQRLVDLSYYVDSRLKQIASAGAASNESHLLVLTALVMADEIYDLKEQVEYYKQQAEYAAQVPQNQRQAEQDAYVSEVIGHLADKIANISGRLKSAA
jgi:cell division protein ZapA